MRNIWLIDTPWFETAHLPKLLQAHRAGGAEYLKQESDEERRRKFYKQFNRLKDPLYADGPVGVIEVVGTLLKGATPYERLNGATDYDDLALDVASAMADPKIKAVVIDVDSGGGMALGAPEIADMVAELAAIKPVVAHTSSIMASAAYYICAGASAVTASRSGVVGSIGTVAQVLDITGVLEKFGVKVETFTPDQSDLKTAGYPTVPMTDEQRAYIKASVTETNNEFMGFVKSHRAGIENDSMRGQCFSGQNAEGRGLIDGQGSFAEAKRLALALAKG
jgi:capsid assembly protease